MLIKNVILTYFLSDERWKKAKKISQDELAEMLGINRVSIFHLEKGKNHPTYDNVIKMSEILGIDLLTKETSVKNIPVV